LKSAVDTATHSVQLLVRTGDRAPVDLQKTLRSIQQQTYPNLAVLLLTSQPSDALDQVLEKQVYKHPIQVLKCAPDSSHRNNFWQGLQSVSTDYFGVLESGTVLASNHIHTLVQWLDKFPALGLVYSEVIQIAENLPETSKISPCEEVIDRAKLIKTSFDQLPFRLPFSHPINLNGVLARSLLIDEFLRQDPHLKYLEDLFLLLNLGVRASALFSYETTCQIEGNFSDLQTGDRALELEFIKSMMGDRVFPTGTHSSQIFAETNSLQSQLQRTQAQLHHTEAQLHQAHQRITAMETSKFWQLRKQWFQLKRRLGLNSDRE
jgi:hypothetical protein